VRADKEREVADGHDALRVAHPALVPIAREVFDRVMQGPQSAARLPDKIGQRSGSSDRADGGDYRGGIAQQRERQRAVSWPLGWAATAAYPSIMLMEDAATAEIARAQIWQWIHHPRGILADGRRVPSSFFRALLQNELARLAHVERRRMRRGIREAAGILMR